MDSGESFRLPLLYMSNHTEYFYKLRIECNSLLVALAVSFLV
jgi:hypothetical protein